MSARSGSLGWVVLAGGVSIGIASAIWGVLDVAFVGEITATNTWSAPPGSVLNEGRTYVLRSWDWLILIVVLRVGLEALVSSRLVGATTRLPVSTFVLVILHLFLVVWMATIPEMAQPIYELATTDYSAQLAALSGLDTAVTLSYEWGIGLLPAVLLVVSDGWYLSAPIRNDLLRR